VVLGRYLALRLNLAAAIDSLDEDPLWREWKLTNNAEAMPIGQLAKVRVNFTALSRPDSPHQDTLQPDKPPEGSPTKRPAAAPRSPNNAPDGPPGKTEIGALAGIAETRPASFNLLQNGPTCKPTDPGCPAAPTLVSAEVFVQLAVAQQIADFLAQLNDSDLLTRTRNASNLFSFAVYRWAVKRDNLIAQSRFKSGSPILKSYDGPDSQSPGNFTPAADTADLLGLTLSAVRELAKAELPPVDDGVKLDANDDGVELTTGSLPRSLYGASLFGQVLLFFAVVYFGAFALGAVSAEDFPEDESIFAAFARTRLSHVVFLVAVWTPLAVSVGILLFSFEATSIWGSLGLACCTALVGTAVVSVYNTLSRKLYFDPILKGLGPPLPGQR
jgi:hypothetical protein